MEEKVSKADRSERERDSPLCLAEKEEDGELPPPRWSSPSPLLPTAPQPHTASTGPTENWRGRERERGVGEIFTTRRYILPTEPTSCLWRVGVASFEPFGCRFRNIRAPVCEKSMETNLKNSDTHVYEVF